MTETTVATQTASAVLADYPGLTQAAPYSIGEPLHNVRLETGGTARYAVGDYEVHVRVGQPAHLSGDPDDESLQREARAQAVLAHTAYVDTKERGHLEWTIPNPRSEIVFPGVSGAVAADVSDPRFSSGVLVLVAAALDRAVAAVGRAAEGASGLAQEAEWDRERPEGVNRGMWLRQQRRAARAEARSDR